MTRVNNAQRGRHRYCEKEERGHHVTTWLNGVEMIDLRHEAIGPAQGVIALQIHSGGGIKIRWRHLRVTEL